MTTITRRAALGAAAGLALAPAAARPQEQRFPSRPISVIVPFPAGGATDVQMRALAEAAARRLGQPVVIENRPGAGSTLGAAAIARARPDGYLVAQMTLPALRLPLMQRMAYDPRRDFTPIIHLTGYLFGIFVRAESPYQTWQDLVADARRRPGEVRIGNTGANGTPHLTVVDLAERERIEVVHVPFRGEADAMPQVLGGHIEATAAGSGAGPLVDEGKLRMLNVWSRERSPRFPRVPTLIELGYPDMVVTSPYGLVGPAGGPHAGAGETAGQIGAVVVARRRARPRGPGTERSSRIGAAPDGYTPTLGHMGTLAALALESPHAGVLRALERL